MLFVYVHPGNVKSKAFILAQVIGRLNRKYSVAVCETWSFTKIRYKFPYSFICRQKVLSLS